MRKVIVVSDSHGLVEPLEQIYERYKNEVDAFLHCGDSELPLDHPIFKHYETVRGNCDFQPFSMVKELNIGEYKILFTHGHQHRVKFTLNDLYDLGLEEGADLVCYGHTHRPLTQRKKGLVVLNPGSLRRNRGFGAPPECFALVELDKKIKVSFLSLDNFKEIKIKLK